MLYGKVCSRLEGLGTTTAIHTGFNTLLNKIYQPNDFDSLCNSTIPASIMVVVLMLSGHVPLASSASHRSRAVWNILYDDDSKMQSQFASPSFIFRKLKEIIRKYQPIYPKTAP